MQRLSITNCKGNRLLCREVLGGFISSNFEKTAWCAGIQRVNRQRIVRGRQVIVYSTLLGFYSIRYYLCAAPLGNIQPRIEFDTRQSVRVCLKMYTIGNATRPQNIQILRGLPRHPRSRMLSRLGIPHLVGDDSSETEPCTPRGDSGCQG
jgi:hypothetical protein